MPNINARTAHTVQPRDTLDAIARAHHTTTEELARINGLTRPDLIHVGQVLRLLDDAFVRDATPESTAARVSARLVHDAAIARARDYGATYATDAHARSPNPSFPSSGTPGGYWKCNMFAGDVLYDAGFVPPQYASGWYELSQNWPKHTHLFHEVPRAEARAGDILILDRGATSDPEGGGHALVLTSGIDGDGRYSCIAVKSDGAYEHTRNVNSDTAGRDDNGNPYRAVVLRPHKQRNVRLPDVPVVDRSATLSAPTIPLRHGDRGENVKLLQQCLVKLDCLTDAAMATGPGVFGDKTKAAVHAFQLKYGVTVEPGFEGVYGPKTQAALIAALG